MVIGKAKEKRLSVGADLVMTPIETFIRSKTIANGNIIIAPELNINPAAESPACIIELALGNVPIGRNS